MRRPTPEGCSAGLLMVYLGVQAVGPRVYRLPAPAGCFDNAPMAVG
jgi:hypothetical protein